MTCATDNISHPDLPSIYQNALPTKAEKFKNLQNMCDYIPLKYVEFYDKLTAN